MTVPIGWVYLLDDGMEQIEKIPGLSALVEKLTDSIAVFIYTTIEPFLKPLLQTATTQLASTSAEVINSHDQYEVFNDPRAVSIVVLWEWASS